MPDDCTVCERPRRASRAAEIWKPEPAAPLWIPEPAEPEPLSRSRVLPALPIVVLIGALATAAVIGGPRLMGAPRQPAAPVTADPVAAPSDPSRAPILEDAAVRLVTVHPAVDDPRAADVAAMFDTYFTGINERDYRAVARVLDPAGELDPGVPGQLKAFAEGTSTSRDSDVVLRRLTSAASGRLRAEVSFLSRQKAGHGPPERPGETCTRWDVVYVLTADGGAYRMLRGDGTNQPC
ncbi:hypothetical protein AB0G04_24165 [Actinoplanes sp. NPDC023801]|uniref:hypothetical protein n=1 Tax=Actinoplanes sp. NPDC023801 TaxID=3154595 RepID=UPI0033EE4D60